MLPNFASFTSSRQALQSIRHQDTALSAEFDIRHIFSLSHVFVEPRQVMSIPCQGLHKIELRGGLRDLETRGGVSVDPASFKDKLPAISGIAKWLANRFLIGDIYLAGLWYSQLPRDLLWYQCHSFPITQDQALEPSSYRAPSWTWASLDRRDLEWLDASSQSTTSKIIDYKLSYKGSDHFGEHIF